MTQTQPTPGYSPFANMGSVASSQSANYLRQGDYLMRIKAAKVKQNRKNTLSAIFECVVVHCYAAGNTLDGTPVPPHQTGEEVSMVFNLTQDYSMPKIKALICHAFGLPGMPFSDAEVNQEVADAVFGPTNPLQGRMLRVRGTSHKTQKDNEIVKETVMGRVLAEQIAEVVDENTIERIWGSAEAYAEQIKAEMDEKARIQG